jgi:hypothetical protein
MRAVPQSKISRAFQRAVSPAIDKRDYVEDLAANSQTGLARLAQNRKWLLTALGLGLLATAVVWIVAVCFPDDVADIYSIGVNSNLPRLWHTGHCFADVGPICAAVHFSICFEPSDISVAGARVRLLQD